MLPSLGSTSTVTETGHTKFVGVYRIYGGGLGDPLEPTVRDTKIMFAVQGQVARSMFEAMGPDARDACTNGSGLRVRTKDKENLVCIRTKKGDYSCNFGFDLKTGKSIGGSLC